MVSCIVGSSLRLSPNVTLMGERKVGVDGDRFNIGGVDCGRCKSSIVSEATEIGRSDKGEEGRDEKNGKNEVALEIERGEEGEEGGGD